ncbi:TPA: hypothetical protein JLC67_001164 [Escherichia coli]|nr:hypothetical protein BIZ41_14325 [Escherichia coli]HAV8362221.1 hypothetical protein [Escherichia coli]
MLSIILTGHGGFASGMEKAMKQILGEQSQFIAIDFPEPGKRASVVALDSGLHVQQIWIQGQLASF